MPMGAFNSLIKVSTFMNQAFHNCADEFVIGYIDDHLIFSKDKKYLY